MQTYKYMYDMEPEPLEQGSPFEDIREVLGSSQ